MPNFTFSFLSLFNGMYSVIIQYFKLYEGNGLGKTVFVIMPPGCLKMGYLCIKIIRLIYCLQKEKYFA